MKKSAVVVGGGIVGLFSAIYLKPEFDQVVILEKDKEIGGLLKSITNEDGIKFDYGTHIPCETLIPTIDNILFRDVNPAEWEIFSNFDVGNFFLGSIYENSGYANTLNLPKEKYQEGLIDFLNGEGTDYQEDNLERYLNKVYGKGYTELIYEPLMKKIVGEPLCSLHTKSFKLFDIGRLIVGDYNLTKELKKSATIDSKSAYPDYMQGASANKKFYPKNNQGITRWMEELTKQALELGIEIKTNCDINGIKQEDEKITMIELSNGEYIYPEKVIWSVAPYILLKHLDIVRESKGFKPEFLKSIICNVVVDRNFKLKNQYLYCLDPNMKSYRITLYPNLTKTLVEKNIFNCTVEIFLDKDMEFNKQEIIQELIKMSILDESFNILSFDYKVIENGFPIITEAYIKEMKTQNDLVLSKVNNVILLGKAKGEKFFMMDTLIEAYEELTEMYGRG
ncbi:NAD(P)-binding protein [Lysinibacillus sp. NPDC096212]|uniref:NAD(P)-binding protein n=1 Tax=Lysinibacillus sp. NPDC096212 TaxID=3364135 RepID=UPI0038284329